MTCIIGLLDGNDVYIGGDSAGVKGYDIVSRKDEKVFRNGEMIFGFTTSFRMGQLLRYKLKVPEQHPNENDDYKFMVTTFIDEVKKCLRDNEFSRVVDSEPIGGTFLVGYRRALYKIGSDFDVGKSHGNYLSVGCGEDIAHGAMGILDSDKKLTAEEKLSKALNVVEFHSMGVKGPFTILKL